MLGRWAEGARGVATNSEHQAVPWWVAERIADPLLVFVSDDAERLVVGQRASRVVNRIGFAGAAHARSKTSSAHAFLESLLAFNCSVGDLGR